MERIRAVIDLGAGSYKLLSRSDEDRLVCGDRLGVDAQAGSKLIEVALPCGAFFIGQRRERAVGGAQNLVPDVLRLPQIQLEGQLRDGAGERKNLIEN